MAPMVELRRMVGIAWMLALLGMIGCGTTRDTRSTSAYLALGDSYTIGESVSVAERWPVVLAGKLKEAGVDVGEPVIVARTGWTTDELSRGMDAAGVKGPYRLVTLLIGVNNQYRGRSVEEFRGELKGLLTRAIGLAGGKPGRVVIVSIPDWGRTPYAEGRDREKIGREIDAFNAVCKEEAQGAGAAYVDVTGISRQVGKEAGLVAGDGLHPSGEMYRRWVEVIEPVALEAVKGNAK